MPSCTAWAKTGSNQRSMGKKVGSFSIYDSTLHKMTPMSTQSGIVIVLIGLSPSETFSGHRYQPKLDLR